MCGSVPGSHLRRLRRLVCWWDEEDPRGCVTRGRRAATAALLVSACAIGWRLFYMPLVGLRSGWHGLEVLYLAMAALSWGLWCGMECVLGMEQRPDAPSRAVARMLVGVMGMACALSGAVVVALVLWQPTPPCTGRRGRTPSG